MAVKYLDSIVVSYGKSERKVSLYSGDISALTKAEAVDFIAVSAFPNDYAPFPNCPIGDLANKGVSVAALSKDKAVDYRNEVPCWISKPVSGQDYERILVYEPTNPKVNSCEQVTCVFSAIAEFLKNSVKDTKVAVSLFSTHYGSVGKKEMLSAIFYAAVHWGAMKFPFKEIKIVLLQEETELKNLFTILKNQYINLETLPISQNYKNYANSVSEKIGSISIEDGDVLTRRQLFGIMMYTSQYYLTIHKILNENNKSSQDYLNHLPLFEACDTGLMNIKPCIKTLYRGQQYMAPELIAKHQPGADIPTLSYTSYSYEMGSFFTSRNYKFIMGTDYTASKIENYSMYKWEREVLFVRGMVYRVNSSKKEGSAYLFDVDEKYFTFRR